MLGAVYFGVNNYEAGKMAGVELCRAIRERWNSQLDRLIVIEQPRAGSLTAMRIKGQLDVVLEEMTTITAERIIRVECDNTSEGTYATMKTVLATLSPTMRIALICYNDDAAYGALCAAKETGLTDNLLLVGQGADRRLRNEMRKASVSVVGATAYRPEDYGDYLVQLALDILGGKPVSPANYMVHFFVSGANVDHYYPTDHD